MCGRYASTRGRQELVDFFGVDVDEADHLEPDYNVAPTKPVPVVLARGGGERPRDVRELHLARWGLVPSWAKDVSIGARMINARVETAHEKPAFRRAFSLHRCIVPADGYYEWQLTEDGGKQPHFIHPADGGVLAMAGLYEVWSLLVPAAEGRLASHPVSTAVNKVANNGPELVRPLPPAGIDTASPLTLF